MLARTEYSREGFFDPRATICKDCNRPNVLRQRKLEDKRFDCWGPCRRKKLTHDEFTSTMLLFKEVKKWVCKVCQFPKCDECQQPCQEPLPFGPKARSDLEKNKLKKWICERCLYPPCSGCGLKHSRKGDLRGKLWFCQQCWDQPAKKTKQKHPPCSGCGAKKKESLQRDAHAHRAWRCSTCWSKAAR